MKMLLLTLLMPVWFPGTGYSRSLVEWRNSYYAASASEKAARQFLDELERTDVTGDPLLQGYKGMAYMIIANYAWNPYTKLSSFQKGKTLLEAAIQKQPSGIELRFLRLGVQSNAPFFLGYNQHLDEDKTAIINGWQQISDEDLKKRIAGYMQSYDGCDDREKQLFNQ